MTSPRFVFQFSLVAGTLAILTFAAEGTLRPLFVSLDRDVSTFAVWAQRKGPNDPAGSGFAILVTPIADGRAVPADSVDGSGDWRLEDARAYSLRTTKDSSEHDPLSFHGREVVVVVDVLSGAGLVRLARDGRDLGGVDLAVDEGPRRKLALESPRAPSSRAVLLVMLGISAACAWWFGLRRNHLRWLWLVLFLSVLHLLFWASQCVGTTSDSPAYLNSLSLFVAGQPAYFPPGYPALLGLVGAVSSESLGRWTVLIQHGMVVGAAVWTYLLLRRIVAEEIALLGGILAGALPPLVTTAQTVMSESPTSFAMVGAVYFAVRSAESGSLRLSVLSGLLAGWAGLLRLVPLVGLLPSVAVIQLLPRRPHRFRVVGMTMASTALVMLLPMAWLVYKSGRPRLVDSTGFHLFNRVVNEQRQLDEAGPATSVLLNLLEGEDPRGVNVWKTYEQVERRGGQTEEQMEGLFREVALEGIRKDLWRFLLFTPRLAWRMLLNDRHDDWIPGWGITRSVHPRLESSPPLGLTASALTWRWSFEATHRHLWFSICWAALGGTILGWFLPQRLLILALAWVPCGYVLSTAAVEFLCPRYNVPVIPFVVALAMVPVALIVRRLEAARGGPPDER